MGLRRYLWAVVMLAATCGGGCATTLTPQSNLRERRDVYVLDHGRTSSLVVPDGKGGLIRYAYGDWDWYALRKTGPLNAIAAVCWPTPAALGRCEHPGPPTLENVRAQVATYTEHLHVVPVEAKRLATAREELERLYSSNIQTEVHTPSVGLSFVRHPDPYWWAHDSNHELAVWLAAMGVEVSGPAIFSKWEVREE